jgi:hypothetical protein
VAGTIEPTDLKQEKEEYLMIFRNRIKLCSILLAVFLMVWSVPGFALDLDIAAMTQQAPYFDAYPGASGIVWYRSHDYSLLPDGKMQKNSNWVLLARKDISSRWLNWSFPVLPGGKVEKIEAGVYNPGTSRLIAPVLPEYESHKGMDVVKVKFPVLQDEFIIHISVNEIIPKDCRLDDLAYLAQDIPVWEQGFTVQLPAGTEMHHISRGAGEPARSSREGQEIYKWTVVGTDPWTDRSLARTERSFLAFSLRKGTRAISAALKDLENAMVPPVPSGLSNGLDNKSSGEIAGNMVDHLRSLPVFHGFSEGVVRPEIPVKGPWTEWEKTIVLGKWLSASGLDVSILWPSRVSIDENTPQTRGLISLPVLEIKSSGSSSTYYVPGRSFPTSISSLSVADRFLYEVQGDTLQRRIISPGTPSENRITAIWNLALSEDGSVSGKVRLYSYSGWNSIFFGDTNPNEGDAERLLEDLTGGVVSGDLSLQQRGTSYIINGEVYLPPAIMNSDRALIRMPGIDVDELKEITGTEAQVSFPFMIKDEFSLSFPGKAELVALPSVSGEKGSNSEIKVSLRSNSRKSTVTGSRVLTVRNTDLEQGDLRGPLRRWALWSEKTLPFKFKKPE